MLNVCPVDFHVVLLLWITTTSVFQPLQHTDDQKVQNRFKAFHYKSTGPTGLPENHRLPQTTADLPQTRFYGP